MERSASGERTPPQMSEDALVRQRAGAAKGRQRIQEFPQDPEYRAEFRSKMSQRHGGRVAATRTEDGWTRFVVALPIPARVDA